QPPCTSAIVGRENDCNADRRHGAAREFVVLLRRDRAQPVEKRKIGAELEMLPRAFDDNAAQPRLAVEPRKRVDQLFDQRAVIGVADAWPVQRDGRDAAPIDLAQHWIINRHKPPPQPSPACGGGSYGVPVARGNPPPQAGKGSSQRRLRTGGG